MSSDNPTDPKLLARLMENATPEQKEQIAAYLTNEEFRGERREKLLKDVFEESVPPMDEFVFGKKYLGLPKASIFPRVMDLLVLADDPSIREVWLCIGKGGGKSTIASIIKARGIHRLVKHYRDPSSYFELLPEALIAVITMSPTAEQAKNVMFNKFGKLIQNAPCFHYPDGRPMFKTVERHIEFTKNVHALSGHSNYRAYFGYDVFMAVLDEFSWFMDTEHHDVSEEILQGVKSSALTRFPLDHKIVGISTPQSKDDALYSRVDHVVRTGRRVLLGEAEGSYASTKLYN